MQHSAAETIKFCSGQSPVNPIGRNLLLRGNVRLPVQTVLGPVVFSAMKPNKLLLIAMIAGSPMWIRAQSRVDFGININVPAPGAMVVEAPPPPLRGEIITAPPGPGFVWIAGHWAWRGHWRHWVWVRGRWAPRPYPNAQWIAGHWAPASGGWVWIDGQWVSPPPPSNVAGQPAPYPAPEIVVAQPPPPPVPEAIYPAPGPGFFWIAGFWNWQGRWMWTPGHYERHPHFHPGAGWVDGHWDRRGGGYVWIGGHWT
jgi:hypothetical protein